MERITVSHFKYPAERIERPACIMDLMDEQYAEGAGAVRFARAVTVTACLDGGIHLTFTASANELRNVGHVSVDLPPDVVRAIRACRWE